VIERCRAVEQPGWLALRQALWADCSGAEHLRDMAAIQANPEIGVAFVAYGAAGEALGFAEVALRRDYVNGTESSPVGFLEGIYVIPEARRQGIARALVAAAERWVAAAGCREFASDAALDNHHSHALHYALGFEETERVVYFRKRLGR